MAVYNEQWFHYVVMAPYILTALSFPCIVVSDTNYNFMGQQSINRCGNLIGWPWPEFEAPGSKCSVLLTSAWALYQQIQRVAISDDNERWWGRTLQTHSSSHVGSARVSSQASAPTFPSMEGGGPPLSNVSSQLCKALGGRIPSWPQQAITWCPEAWSLITLISVYHCIKDCWWEYWPRAPSMKRCRPVSRNTSGFLVPRFFPHIGNLLPTRVFQNKPL